MSDLNEMSNKIVSRRDAMKKAGSAVAAAGLAFLGLGMPGITKQKEAMAMACGWCDGFCEDTCTDSCSDTCIGGCKEDCEDVCFVGCNYNCYLSCYDGCYGDCYAACSSWAS